VSETSKFTEDILAVARQKAQEIVTDAETETQRALDEAKIHLSREANDVVRNARTEAESTNRRQMSEVRHRLKLQEQQEKNKILSEVLERTRKRILEIANDENKYFPYLVDFIESGINALGKEDVTIHLNINDLKRIDKGKLEREVTKKLAKPVLIEWAKEPLEASGGVVISSSDGKTRIVNTLDQRFEALESKLLIEAGQSLFGD
jgi:vacuolar-type H+-ATPase subunit E/Vma4